MKQPLFGLGRLVRTDSNERGGWEMAGEAKIEGNRGRFRRSYPHCSNGFENDYRSR